MYALHKLNEAEFFWNMVKATPVRTTEHAFYFSAFFSAFRSITFVLQSQYKQYSGFTSLYDRVLANLGRNDLFGDLKEARNIALKEGAKVPALVTKFSNDATHDAVVYECDPLPDSEDVIRRVSVEIGMRREWLVPAEMPEEDRSNLYMSQLWHVLNEFKCTPPQVEQLVRIAPGGAIVSLAELSTAIDSALAFFRGLLPEFEALVTNTGGGSNATGT